MKNVPRYPVDSFTGGIGTSRHHLSVKDITLTAVFMAMNIALSSFGLPVPGGHIYLNDIVIMTASLLLNPFEAFLVGGIDAFLGDFFFYPTPMFVSLVVHGLQVFVISWIAHSHDETSLKKDIPAVIIGAVIMVIGYKFAAKNPHACVWDESRFSLTRQLDIIDI
jgi:uncharacterized membrane protein